MENAAVAGVLEEMADILEIQGANPFRIRSYRSAAETVRGLGEALDDVRRHDRLEDLPHVGESIATTIGDLLDTGEAAAHRELLDSPEAPLVALTRVSGIGPKHARQLGEELGVTSLDELEQAARQQKIRGLSGFGVRSEEKILRGIAQARQRQDRFLLSEAWERATRLVEELEEVDGVDRVTVAGSLRRWTETVGDLDILVTCAEPGPVMERLVVHDGVDRVIGRGDTRTSVVMGNGMQVDLRVVPEESYGAALVYFTGSKEHNIALRKRGVRRGLKINEYGVFRDDEDGERVGGRTEEEVYAAVDLAWIPPELRQDRGEIDAAAGNGLPELVRLEEIRGDCQMHTTASDGEATIEEMADAAAALGREYIVITDHSQRVTMANGLDEERLRQQWEEIDRIDSHRDDIRILRGVEVDILADGSLDLDDGCLTEADVVVAAAHYDLEMGRDEMTRRIVRALENPHVDILAHPTGRRLLRRAPLEIDMEAIIEAAREHRVLLECNASPQRLDLGDVHLRRAAERGVPVVVSTDAHRTRTLASMRYGVAMARRGWLTAADVANTRPLEEFLSLLDEPCP